MNKAMVELSPRLRAQQIQRTAVSSRSIFKHQQKKDADHMYSYAIHHFQLSVFLTLFSKSSLEYKWLS